MKPLKLHQNNNCKEFYTERKTRDNPYFIIINVRINSALKIQTMNNLEAFTHHQY